MDSVDAHRFRKLGIFRETSFRTTTRNFRALRMQDLSFASTKKRAGYPYCSERRHGSLPFDGPCIQLATPIATSRCGVCDDVHYWWSVYFVFTIAGQDYSMLLHFWTMNPHLSSCNISDFISKLLGLRHPPHTISTILASRTELTVSASNNATPYGSRIRNTAQ